MDSRVTFANVDEASSADASALFARMSSYKSTEPFTSSFEFMAGVLPESGRVVDVGPGNGEDAAVLSSLGFDVTGVDVRTDLVSPSSWTLLQGSAYDLPVSTGSVQVVWANRVIHHLLDLERFAAEAFRVLVPGGLVVVCWPDRSLFACSDSALDVPVRKFLLGPGCDTAAPRSKDQVLATLEAAGFAFTACASFTHRKHGSDALGYALPLVFEGALDAAAASMGPGQASRLREFVSSLEEGAGWVDLSLTVLVLSRPWVRAHSTW